jgi:hypothetical protein
MALEQFMFTRNTETGEVSVVGTITVKAAAHCLMDIALSMERDAVIAELKESKEELKDG